MTRWFAFAVLVAGVAAITGCGEETAPHEDHTPHSARLFAAGQELTPNVTVPRGLTVRIEVRFYDDHGDLLEGLEAGHFAALTFTPAALATVAPVTGQRFFFDVTAQNAAGSGQVTVGYGHSQAADEVTVGPFPVTIP